MTNTIHGVNTLSEYIAVIEKNELFHCISRGENALYPEPCSSGIRRYGGDDYKALMEEYYLEVEPDLSTAQNKHFPAFAQHHGIPTNLLDFSYSPLTSLFFSVNDCNEAGYVYFISKRRLVQINKIIEGKGFGWGMLNGILQFEPDLIGPLLPGLTKGFMDSRESCIAFFEEHVQRLIDSHPHIHYVHSDRDPEEKGTEELRAALAQYLNDKERWRREYPKEPVTLQIYSSFPNFIKGFHHIYQGVDIRHPEHFFENYSSLSEVHGLKPIGSANPILLLFLMKYETLGYYNSDVGELKGEHMIEFPLYFTYRPSVIDDRVRNQHSVFIFQPFGKLFPEDVPGGELWQAIVPDFVIRVDNPKGIKKELDSIGVNLKTVYSDYDSVAKYTVGRFLTENGETKC